MSQYVETATDLNVEGVEFYVKNTPAPEAEVEE